MSPSTFQLTAEDSPCPITAALELSMKHEVGRVPIFRNAQTWVTGKHKMDK